MSDADKKQKFEIQRVYMKDASFEAPNTPAVFLQENWKPEISVDLNMDHQKLQEGLFEVVLSLTVNAKHKEEHAFCVEVKKAGIFVVEGFEEEQQAHLLGALCPGILFPFAREIVADLVNRASFPQLVLAPINFDALYQQRLATEQKEGLEETKH